MIFDYPNPLLVRRHGPSGYAGYESYHPWLRDDFTFRCVYCLKREAWGQVTGEFEIDHFEPQALQPARVLDYENLVYACRHCNLKKANQVVPDPLILLNAVNVGIAPDGELISDDLDCVRLIRQLDLNSPRLCTWRVTWLRIAALADERDRELYVRIAGFPEDLPDLSGLKPPANTRPESVQSSWFAKRAQGLLPEVI